MYKFKFICSLKDLNTYKNSKADGVKLPLKDNVKRG